MLVAPPVVVACDSHAKGATENRGIAFFSGKKNTQIVVTLDDWWSSYHDNGAAWYMNLHLPSKTSIMCK